MKGKLIKPKKIVCKNCLGEFWVTSAGNFSFCSVRCKREFYSLKLKKMRADVSDKYEKRKIRNFVLKDKVSGVALVRVNLKSDHPVYREYLKDFKGFLSFDSFVDLKLRGFKINKGD